MLSFFSQGFEISYTAILLSTFLLISLVLYWFYTDHLIQRLHDRVIVSVLYSDDYPKKDIYELKDKVKKSLFLNLGALIGKYERFIYIYCVFISDYQTLAGWLVLKAFFGWIKQPKIDFKKLDFQKIDRDRVHLLTYYLYVLGNLLSLGIGIIIGNYSKIFVNFIYTVS